MSSTFPYSSTARHNPCLTPSEFSVAQFLGQERRELDVPLTEGLVTALNTTLVKQLLNVPLAEREAVVEPQGVADDAERKPVAVGLAVSQCSPLYRR